ncbi:MAG TPA: putative toxin-antitoxin system toxin component, PIN family, partial [Nevskiaceae bacterium]|nr:putative toxin-antitoxin system toxin component, PIN family [Nevskiaceae bacterium]
MRSGAPRVVLDTNTVVSALLFQRGRLAWIRTSWQAGQFIPVVNHDTAAELIRVLAYPKFRLTKGDREILLADFLPFAETVTVGRDAAELPAIRDPDDVVFAALAAQARVDALVSGDGDLQAVRGRLGLVEVLLPAEF